MQILTILQHVQSDDLLSPIGAFGVEAEAIQQAQGQRRAAPRTHPRHAQVDRAERRALLNVPILQGSMRSCSDTSCPLSRNQRALWSCDASL